MTVVVCVGGTLSKHLYYAGFGTSLAKSSVYLGLRSLYLCHTGLKLTFPRRIKLLGASLVDSGLLSPYLTSCLSQLCSQSLLLVTAEELTENELSMLN